MSGMTIAVLLLTMALAAPLAGQECARFIELHSAATIAAEIGETEAWVVRNFTVNLWQRPTPEGKGKIVGRMRAGSRARMLAEGPRDYRVESPLDQSVGWVGKIQVARTLRQDTKTFEPCDPEAVP